MSDPGEQHQSDPIAGGTLDFQLAYGDCDVLGIAYFGIYYRWMERCYTSWLFANGLRSGELLADLGVITVGLSSSAQYTQTVTVFDRLRCQAVADRIGASSYTVGFEFTRGDELVTRGQMTFAVRDADFGKAPIPQRLRDVLGTLPPPSFETP
ncbi:acyl-CoA thioesterase [Gordonia hydrophobica]|uniref:Hotdog domain-containing protein n=1 Tax=Gordonia hydrophobica TaxID=40516 RepID=A0ABZ2TW77_9ACTN|nr:hotdog domain-containing protein [Gordonia hydrophobica]MBM7365835.1 acyl-CoA thioester hydrolase [Gordonia hydrophobica]